jgi:ABC-type nitrate/sulfonate/bicarbonate transport system substrate-binding protein
MLEVIVFEGVQNLPLFAAQEQGFFERRGIELNLHFTPNSWTLRDGLANGSYHIAHTAVDNAIAMAEMAGHDIAIVIGGDSGFNCLVAQPGIEGPDQLRGATVLVDAPDTAFALVLYKILAQRDMHRGDYEIRSVGATPLRLQAMLRDRQAAAAIMNLPFRIQAEDAGLRILGEATDFVGPYLSTSGFVMREWGHANAEMLVRYLQAYVEGLRWALAPANRAAAVEMLERRLSLAPEVAERGYVIATAPNGFARDGALDLDGLGNVLRLRAEVQAQWNGEAPAPQRYVELKWYEQALSALEAGRG